MCIFARWKTIDRVCHMRNAETGEARVGLTLRRPEIYGITCITFSPDNTHITVGCDGKRLRAEPHTGHNCLDIYRACARRSSTCILVRWDSCRLGFFGRHSSYLEYIRWIADISLSEFCLVCCLLPTAFALLGACATVSECGICRSKTVWKP